MDLFVDIDYILTDEYGPFMGGDWRAALREVAQIGQPYPYIGAARVYEVLSAEATP